MEEKTKKLIKQIQSEDEDAQYILMGLDKDMNLVFEPHINPLVGKALTQNVAEAFKKTFDEAPDGAKMRINLEAVLLIKQMLDKNPNKVLSAIKNAFKED